jgi:nitrate/TMAO reductase-like tetraheme cytochrome c subunit
MKNILIILVFGVLATSSVFAAETDDAQQQLVTDDVQQQFIRGAQKWANNCVRCHNSRDPKEFTDSQWRAITFHMRVRAGLTGSDIEDILTFLKKSND